MGSKRWQENLPTRSYWGCRAWISSPRDITRWGKNPNCYLYLWSPATKSDFLAVELGQMGVLVNYLPLRLPSFIDTETSDEGKHIASVICTFRISGQGPQVNQQKVTSFAPSSTHGDVCMAGAPVGRGITSGPLRSRCEDGIKCENFIKGNICVRGNGRGWEGWEGHQTRWRRDPRKGGRGEGWVGAPWLPRSPRKLWQGFYPRSMSPGKGPPRSHPSGRRHGRGATWCLGDAGSAQMPETGFREPPLGLSVSSAAAGHFWRGLSTAAVRLLELKNKGAKVHSPRLKI